MNKAFTYEVRHAVAIGNHLGESPAWSSEQNTLFWVDILEGSVKTSAREIDFYLKLVVP